MPADSVLGRFWPFFRMESISRAEVGRIRPRRRRSARLRTFTNVGSTVRFDFLTYRKNKGSEKTGTLARNPPFGFRREALTCSRLYRGNLRSYWPRGRRDCVSNASLRPAVGLMELRLSALPRGERSILSGSYRRRPSPRGNLESIRTVAS
uniref:Uncharacterized protein n=1 Tax=Candidatus Kentrum sp. TC TaxID=2126339 RepID=A0A450Z1A1_9GAMM|nr:MAG: hypothetical protein BECKTC1821E_GA0114239_10864 [Candidatus Kentron sp. TC]